MDNEKEGIKDKEETEEEEKEKEYEFKFVVDGDSWETSDEYEVKNDGGSINNILHIPSFHYEKKEETNTKEEEERNEETKGIKEEEKKDRLEETDIHPQPEEVREEEFQVAMVSEENTDEDEKEKEGQQKESEEANSKRTREE